MAIKNTTTAAKGFKLREDGSLLTPEFRVSFPHICKANDDGKFGVRAIFDGNVDFTLLESELERATKAMFPTGKPKNFMWPIHDGEESDREEHKGKVYINLSGGKYRPGLVDQNRQDIVDESDFYPGCWARAVVTVYAWSNKPKGKVGISVGVRNIQKLRDDEPLVSRTSAADEFDVVSDAGTEDL